MISIDSASTIVAIASPPGRSLRGMIRISGPHAFTLLQTQPPPVQFNHITPHRGASVVRLAWQPAGSLPAVVCCFPAPRSYTGEDVLELQLPGNPLLLERAVNSLLSLAAERGLNVRLAEPGEFTARAFFNGRLDLTQAEGVAATIAASSDAELAAARLLTSGRVGSFARDLADDLASVLALVEAGIDFTDQDDVVAIAPAQLHARLNGVRNRLNEQLERATGIEQLRAIPWVVLTGQPNAGKSALFNALLGQERAVVASMAGTTRDVLAEPLRLTLTHGGHTTDGEVMLVDVAGVDDEDESEMNCMMQTAAREALSRAELRLRCVPCDVPDDRPPEQDELIVRTKFDLDSHHAASEADGPIIRVSAVTGEGLADLRAAMAVRLADRSVSLAADALALQPRHEAAMRSALTNLDDALALVTPMRDEPILANAELLAAGMRAALDDLASLAGDITPDEILGRIFATFCIGK